MNGGKIRSFIENEPDLKQCFQGLHNFDKLPKLKNNSFVIAFKDGGHWIVYSKMEELELFNSLGSKAREIEKVLPFEKIVFNKSRVQSDESELCGLFSLYYVTARINNMDMDFCDFLEHFFSTNLEENDTIVTNFYNTGDFKEIW